MVEDNKSLSVYFVNLLIIIMVTIFICAWFVYYIIKLLEMINVGLYNAMHQNLTFMQFNMQYRLTYPNLCLPCL